MDQGQGIILCTDMNKESKNGKLAKLFCENGLMPSSSVFSNEKPLPCHISGSKQIDEVWIFPSLQPSDSSVLPHYFCIGELSLSISQ